MRRENRHEKETRARFYVDRTPRRHRDYRAVDRLADAGRPAGARGGAPDPVQEQPQAARHRTADLSRHLPTAAEQLLREPGWPDALGLQPNAAVPGTGTSLPSH